MGSRNGPSIAVPVIVAFDPSQQAPASADTWAAFAHLLRERVVPTQLMRSPVAAGPTAAGAAAAATEATTAYAATTATTGERRPQQPQGQPRVGHEQQQDRERSDRCRACAGSPGSDHDTRVRLIV